MLDLTTLDFTKGNGLVTVVTQDADSGAVLMVAHADREAIERTIATGEMHYRSRTRGAWHKGATSGNVQRVVSLAADCDGDAVLARVVPAGPACHTGATSCFGSGALAADMLGALDATIGARQAAIGAMEGGDGGRGAPPRAQDPAADAGSPHLTVPLSSERDAPVPAAAGAPPRAQHGGAAESASHRSDARGVEGTPSGGAAPVAPSYTQRLLGDRNLRLKKIGEEAAELVVACADEDAARAVEEGADLLYHTLVALRPLGVTLDDVRRVLARRHAGARG